MTNLTQYQTAQHLDLEAPAATGVQIREQSDTISVSIRDGVVTETRKGNDSGSTSQLNPHHGTESVLATAQHPRGLPVYAIEDTTLVTVDGIQAPAAFWIKEGVLTKAPDGTITEAHQVAPQEAPEEVNPDAMELHPRNAEEVAQALGDMSESNVDALIATTVGASVGRLDPGAVALKFSQITGIDGHEATVRLNVLQTVFQTHANRAAEAAGVVADDMDQFWAWARSKHQSQLQDAVGRQFHMRDLSGYKALAAKYMTANAPSVEALQRAGLAVRKSSHKAGSVEVFIPGAGRGWMSPMAAAKAGLI